MATVAAGPAHAVAHTPEPGRIAPAVDAADIPTLYDCDSGACPHWLCELVGACEQPTPDSDLPVLGPMPIVIGDGRTWIVPLVVVDDGLWPPRSTCPWGSVVERCRTPDDDGDGWFDDRDQWGWSAYSCGEFSTAYVTAVEGSDDRCQWWYGAHTLPAVWY